MYVCMHVWNGAGAEGATALAGALERNSSLTTLNLFDNRVGVEAPQSGVKGAPQSSAPSMRRRTTGWVSKGAVLAFLS